MHSTNVIGVVVTQNDPSLSKDLVRRLSLLQLQRIIVVVNSNSTESRFEQGRFIFIHTGSNLGGAGGFAFGLNEALKLSPAWVWTCDDDAEAEQNTIIEDLVNGAERSSSDLIAPIIVSPQDTKRLSFPFRVRFHRTWIRKEIESTEFIQGQAHLFNGSLFKASMISTLGLPDTRLFIRGDEQEYLLRIKKSRYVVTTTTKVAMIHPSGEDELHPILFNLLKVPIPLAPIKFSYQIRNRGYLTRKYFRIDWLLVDFIRYTIFFLLRFRPQPRALLATVQLYRSGLRNRIEDLKIIDEVNWARIVEMTKCK